MLIGTSSDKALISIKTSRTARTRWKTWNILKTNIAIADKLERLWEWSDKSQIRFEYCQILDLKLDKCLSWVLQFINSLKKWKYLKFIYVKGISWKEVRDRILIEQSSNIELTVYIFHE
jgi:hypothetical protein